MGSLFGHLAVKFGPHPENLAIEALGYLLGRSGTAVGVLLRLLRVTGVELPADITFRTQATGNDQARPDLEGVSASAGTVAVIEAKFWAALTDNQPVTYLQRLPTGSPAALVFIAPASRFPTLWHEITVRCRTAGIPMGKALHAAPELWAARADDGRSLVLLSWRHLLLEISAALALEHDPLVADVAQLAGLCERMDSEAFLPLRLSEVTSQEMAQRFLQFAQLPLDVADAAVADGLASKKDRAGRQLTPSGSVSGYGRYLAIRGIQVYLAFDCRRWSRFGITPLWLRIDGGDAESKEAARNALFPWRLDDPPRLFDDEGAIWVPLSLPTGEEKPALIVAVLGQLRSVAHCLEPCGLQQAPVQPVP